MYNPDHEEPKKGPHRCQPDAANSLAKLKTAEPNQKTPLSQEFVVGLTEEETIMAGAAIGLMLRTALPAEVRAKYYELASGLEEVINRRFKESGSGSFSVDFTGRILRARQFQN